MSLTVSKITNTNCKRIGFCAKTEKNRKNKTQMFEELTKTLAKRLKKEVPPEGDFINVVQQFSTKNPFVMGYLTVMPYGDEENLRVLTAAVKHQNSDYVCQTFLQVGNNEEILKHLGLLNENSKQLSEIYSRLQASLQEHFDKY